MTRNMAEHNVQDFQWLDMEAPDSNELKQMAASYMLHDESMQDLLQPDHLPKYERLKNYAFIILRFYSADKSIDADTVQEVTDKIAIFINNKFIITIHRKPWDVPDFVKNQYVDSGDCKTARDVLIEIVKAVLKSYDEPALKLTRSMEYYEEHIFLKDRKVPMLKGLYFLKRKTDVIRRVLLLSFDIIDQIDAEENSNAYTRDLRDLYIKQQNVFDAISENTNHLLTIYFSISSQKTNETIRVLTIFSVFFLPLTFIVGIYGMNFEFMPELRWKAGYPGVYVVMLVVTLSIYIWFKKKKWL